MVSPHVSLPQLSTRLNASSANSLGLLSHLYISLHLAPLSTALLTSPSTTSITSDSLLSQLLIARSHLATGPTQKYQDAYYVFEEIKNMQGGRGEGVLSGVGVAQALLGRWDEARDAINEGLEMVRPLVRSGHFSHALCVPALTRVRNCCVRGSNEQNPTHPTLLANSVALALHTGKTAAQADELLSCVVNSVVSSRLSGGSADLEPDPRVLLNSCSQLPKPAAISSLNCHSRLAPKTPPRSNSSSSGVFHCRVRPRQATSRGR